MTTVFCLFVLFFCFCQQKSKKFSADTMEVCFVIIFISNNGICYGLHQCQLSNAEYFGEKTSHGSTKSYSVTTTKQNITYPFVFSWNISYYGHNMLHCGMWRPFPLHWCHNNHDGVSNHQPDGCLLNRLFRRRSKKTSKLRVTGLCVGNSPGPVNSPHNGPVTWKMFPFDDVTMPVPFLDTACIENWTGK